MRVATLLSLLLPLLLVLPHLPQRCCPHKTHQQEVSLWLRKKAEEWLLK